MLATLCSIEAHLDAALRPLCPTDIKNITAMCQKHGWNFRPSRQTVVIPLHDDYEIHICVWRWKNVFRVRIQVWKGARSCAVLHHKNTVTCLSVGELAEFACACRDAGMEERVV